jgi:hypothetical protein
LACGKSDAVYVFDTEKYAQSKLIEVKNMPWGIVTYPKAMGSLDQAQLNAAESTPAK